MTPYCAVQAPVTVFGAHFPQTLNASTHAYDDATAAVKAKLEALGWSSADQTIFMADTNTEGQPDNSVTSHPPY